MAVCATTEQKAHGGSTPRGAVWLRRSMHTAVVARSQNSVWAFDPTPHIDPSFAARERCGKSHICPTFPAPFPFLDFSRTFPPPLPHPLFFPRLSRRAQFAQDLVARGPLAPRDLTRPSAMTSELATSSPSTSGVAATRWRRPPLPLTLTTSTPPLLFRPRSVGPTTLESVTAIHMGQGYMPHRAGSLTFGAM